MGLQNAFPSMHISPLKIYLFKFLITSISCLAFNQQLQGIPKGTSCQLPKTKQNKNTVETKQASEVHLNMTSMLELINLEFQTTVNSTLRAPMNKVDSMQNQRASVNREMQNLRRNNKDTLDI